MRRHVMSRPAAVPRLALLTPPLHLKRPGWFIPSAARFFFIVVVDSTQLARQIQQECTQMEVQ